MTRPRILIAGIGNIFFGDDAFGSEVARLLLRREWPKNVRVVDFGIRSVDLVYAMSDPRDLLILIDAVASEANLPVRCPSSNLTSSRLPPWPNSLPCSMDTPWIRSKCWRWYTK